MIELHPALDHAMRAVAAEQAGRWLEAAELWFASSALTAAADRRDDRARRGSLAARRAAQ